MFLTAPVREIGLVGVTQGMVATLRPSPKGSANVKPALRIARRRILSVVVFRDEVRISSGAVHLFSFEYLS